MNYKVKVNNEAESKEVQELFFELGFGWRGINPRNSIFVPSKLKEYFVGSYEGTRDIQLHGVFNNSDVLKSHKEITIQQLCDMVVLKRNDPKDANYVRLRDGKLYFVNSNKTRSYYMMDDEWTLTKWDEDQLHKQLKPIKECVMKEFLVNNDNKWTLQLLDSDTEENSYRVAVPSGADFLTQKPKGDKCFWDDGGRLWFASKFNKWVELGSMQNHLEKLNHELLWQRPEDFTKVTIDGVEAFNAIANDITVQYRFAGGKWKDYTQDLNHEGSKLKAVHFLCDFCEFRYKPKTIVVNGVEYEDEQKAVKVVKKYFKGD